MQVQGMQHGRAGNDGVVARDGRLVEHPGLNRPHPIPQQVGHVGRVGGRERRRPQVPAVNLQPGTEMGREAGGSQQATNPTVAQRVSQCIQQALDGFLVVGRLQEGQRGGVVGATRVD